MFVQLPLILLAVTVLLLGIASELFAGALGVDLHVLTDLMGMSEDGLEATFYIAAIVASLVGLMLLRLIPRDLAPMGAVGSHEQGADAPGTHHHERVAHVNDPLQSVYVAVILIAGVLAFSSLS